MNVSLSIKNRLGIFAAFVVGMRTLKYEVSDYDSIEKIRFFVRRVEENPYDYVFKQDVIEGSKLIVSETRKDINTYTGDLFGHSDLKIFKKITDKIEIQDNILNKINPNIDENTIGMHIRLTDMNTMHFEHGRFYFDDFKKKLEHVLEVEGKNKIFVASDNCESIKKLEQDFDIIYNDVSKTRNKIEEDKNRQYNRKLADNFYKKEFWEESFLEMLSLSRCGYLVTRISNLNNSSIMFARNLKKVYTL